MTQERYQRPVISFEKFAREDTMMKEFYDQYFVQNNVPDKSEVYANARFFATFSVQSLKYEFDTEFTDTMANRLECYIWMLRKLGYKPGKSLRKNSVSGLHELLSSIFWVVRSE